MRFNKNDLTPAILKIGDYMYLMGDQVFKYIFKFYVCFTECSYEMICLSLFSFVFQKLKDIL